MFKSNFHTHTHRCLHAEGTERELVERAISCGLEILGISDHCPVFDDSEGNRMPWSERNEYLDELVLLKREFAGKIKLYSGFELEYSRKQADMRRELFETGKLDYFILGQHYFTDYTGQQGSTYWIKDPRDFVCYAMDMARGMESGDFALAAHPDLFAYYMTEHCAYADEATKIIIEAALDTDTPLELNANGMRREKYLTESGYRWPYPYRPFWDKAAEAGVKVFVGCDCHAVEQLCDKTHFEAYELAKEWGLTVIDITGDML